MNCYGDEDYRVYNADAEARGLQPGLTADSGGYQASHAEFAPIYLNSEQQQQQTQQQFMEATTLPSRDIPVSSSGDETHQLVITPQTFANFDSQDPEQHKKWMQWINQVKSADRQRLIEQLASLPETGIVIPPPSISSARKQAARPSHVKRPLNAFMVFSKVHRQSVMESDKSMLHKNISKMLGIKWKELSKEEKKLYEIEAQKAKIRHQIEHPDYKYRPKRRVRAKNDDEDTDIDEYEEEQPNMHYQPQMHAFSPADYWNHYPPAAGGYQELKPSPSYVAGHQRHHPYQKMAATPTTSPTGYHANMKTTTQQSSPVATAGYHHYSNIHPNNVAASSSSSYGQHSATSNPVQGVYGAGVPHPTYAYNNTPSSGQSAAPFQPQPSVNGGYNDNVILNLGTTVPSYTTSPTTQYQPPPAQYQELVPSSPSSSSLVQNGDIGDYFEKNFFTHGCSSVDVPPQSCVDADLVSFANDPTWYNELE